jgi:hypothetical protein
MSIPDGSSVNPSQAGERRVSERQLFPVTAEIFEDIAGSRMIARIADISSGGCYVDTINPFPVKTAVRVKICRDGAEFTASGTVRNCQPGLGMGVAFTTMEESSRALLRKWTGGPESQGASSLVSEPQKEPFRDEELLARRLVELLRDKGILTDGDLSVLLPDRLV